MATFTITGGGATGYGANGPNVKVANVVINLTELSGLAAAVLSGSSSRSLRRS